MLNRTGHIPLWSTELACRSTSQYNMMVGNNCLVDESRTQSS